MITLTGKQTIATCDVFLDDTDVLMFYVMPQGPRIALDENGKPMFHLVWYRRPVDKLTPEERKTKLGGGILTMSTDLSPTEAQLTEIRTKLSKDTKLQGLAKQSDPAKLAEQIKIAKKVLKGQGPGAWPTCSRKAGLTRKNGAAAGGSSSTKAKVVSTSSVKAKTVTVRSGDTLSKIAARHDVRGGWEGLWKLNKAKVKNPNQIKVGMKLRIR